MSTEQISVRRRTTAEKLRRRLKGDLDNIVLMAMRKEPGRRYASVEQFSEDIRRHLEGLPVMARKDTMSYRAGKFIRRHKLGMIAAGLILMALLVGMATTLWQAGLAKAQQARAERRFNDVRKLAHSLLFELHDAIRDLPGATPARELLVKRALTYLDSLAQEAGDDLALQRDLATAYDRVGDIQGNPYSANLGDTAGALQSYQRALAIRRALAAADPTDVETQRGLAASYMNIGDILEVTGERTSALQSYRRALAIRKALVAQSPSDKQARLDLAQSYDTMGHTLTKMADLDGALEHLRQAVAIREALAREDPSSIPARRGLAVSYDQIGFIMALRDDAAKALQNYRKALTLRLALSAENPDNATIRRELSYSYNSIGDMLWATNDLTGALEQYRQAVTIGEALAAKDPTNRQSRRDLAISLSNVGNTLAWLGEKTGALENSHTSLAIFQALAAEDAGKAEAQRDLALAYSNLADVWAVLAARPAALTRQRIERWRQARSWYQRSLDVWLKLRQQGTLSRLDANKPDRARQNIAKCDAALARLKGR